jgi:hypothetical protein
MSAGILESFAVSSVLPVAIVLLAILTSAWRIALMAALRFVRLPCSSIVVWAFLVALVLNVTEEYQCCRVLYGGEDNEAIRFMDTVLDEEQWLVELEAEKRAVEEMAFVKGSVDFFYSDAGANLNKVQATVWCCWAGSTFKRVMVACDEKDKPTHLEALRVLRAKLAAEHMGAGHEPHARAVERRRELEAAGSVEAPEPANAFDQMRAARARLSLLEKKAAADERVAELARQTERVAREKREAAEAAAKQSKAAADALKPKEPSHKKQMTAFVAGSSSQQQTNVCEPLLDGDEEPTYTTWTPAKWKELETKEQQRRTKPIDPARAHGAHYTSLISSRWTLTDSIGSLCADQHGGQFARRR